MRVLILTSRDILGNSGEATLMRSKEAALKSMGCAVCYVVFRWRRFRVVSDNRIIHSLPTWLWVLNPVLCYYIVKRIVISWRPDVLVVSGHWLKFHPWIIARLRRVRPLAISLDLQGALEEWTEYLLAFGSKFISCLVERAIAVHERILVRQVDVIEVVSFNFKRYIENKYPWFTGKIVVVPCGIEEIYDDFSYRELRRVWREKLGIGSDETAAVYSGGLSRWQRIEDVIDFAQKHTWLKVYMFINCNARAIRSSLPPNIKVMTLSPEESKAALCAFDYGFLLRFDNTTNHVSFPNKASEYLNARLRVVMDARNLGCVLPNLSFAFVGLEGVVPLDQSVEKKAYPIENICYRETVSRLVAAYRAAIDKNRCDMGDDSTCQSQQV